MDSAAIVSKTYSFESGMELNYIQGEASILFMWPKEIKKFEEEVTIGAFHLSYGMDEI